MAALVLLAASLGIARLYPRKVLDIGWGDLFAAAWHLLVSRESERAQLDREVADLWSGAGDGFACLSVRTSMERLAERLVKAVRCLQRSGTRRLSDLLCRCCFTA